VPRFFARVSGKSELPDPVSLMLRKLRISCQLFSRKVDVNISRTDDGASITSEDSMRMERPFSRIKFMAKNAFEFIFEKFDSHNDTKPAEKLRFAFRRFVEFRPKNNDSDFETGGYREDEDDILNRIELNMEGTPEPIEDYGSVDLYTSAKDLQSDSFIRVLRATHRFGVARLSRLILTLRATNVRNGIYGQVIIPSGFGYSVLIEHPPYTDSNSSFAIEYDVESDKDEGVLERNTTDVEVDSDDSALKLSDETEDSLKFNGTRRLRWRRKVYCKDVNGNDTEVTVRVRLVKTNETPGDAMFTVRKRVVVSFHTEKERCARLLWDPTGDIGDSSDPTIGPTDATASTGASTTGSGTGAGTSGVTTTGATSGTTTGATSGTTTGATTTGATTTTGVTTTTGSTTKSSTKTSSATHLIMGLATLMCALLF